MYTTRMNTPVIDLPINQPAQPAQPVKPEQSELFGKPPSLTDDQDKALAFLHAFINNKRHKTNKALLCGYAGTGKTFLIAYWLHLLITTGKYHPGDICICAPTHKALDVLRQQCGYLGIAFRTLNSLLGVAVRRNDLGDMEQSHYDSDVMFKLVVCDESSMVNAEFDMLLDREVRAKRILKLLNVGDPAQLPPVKEELSPVFKTDPRDTFTLMEPVRFAGQIIAVATYLRKCVTEGLSFNLFDMQGVCDPADRSVCYIKRESMYPWAQHAIRQNLDVRVLAWTNAAVLNHNKRMHEDLYPDDEFFGVGERVMANDTFQVVRRKEGERAQDDDSLYNGEMLTVSSCELTDPVYGVKCFKVHAMRDSGKPIVATVAKSEAHRLEMHRELNELIYGIRGQSAYKTDLIAVRKQINTLCPLRHSYANTVHKSQGSTYQISIVDFGDVYRSDDRARLMYVGSTRPSKFLVFSR